MKFVKMHGLGNDFLIFDCLENGDSEHAPVWLNAERVQKLCDRHYGIGADGVICVLPSKVADFRMLICNADGSRAQMCGNGIRCIGKYVSDHGKTEQENLRIETDAGVRQLRLDKGTDRVAVTAVRVDMGTPEFVPEHISARFSYTGVSMGNPHCVIFLNKKEELDQTPMEVYGTEMEHHPAFPNGTNVEFAWIQDAGHIFVRVWERGCGETKACGTGGDLWNQKQAFVSDRTGRRNFFRGSENRMMSMPAKERSFGKICRFSEKVSVCLCYGDNLQQKSVRRLIFLC